MALTRDLHITTPLMSGKDVQHLQLMLGGANVFHHNSNPGLVDGQYGPAVASAVVRMKQFLGYPDAQCLPVAGALLQSFLDGSKALPSDYLQRQKTRQAAAAKAAASKTTGQKALEEAIKHIGTRENPPGSNHNPFGAWFGVDGVAWCNEFVSYCFSVGAKYEICKGFSGAGVYPGKGCTYVPTTMAWLQASHQWIGRSEPQAGDIVIFDWPGESPGLGDHIGIVEKFLGNGRFQTVEGNTSFEGVQGSQSNGGCVARRTDRYFTEILGFGRVK